MNQFYFAAFQLNGVFIREKKQGKSLPKGQLHHKFTRNNIHSHFFLCYTQREKNTIPKCLSILIIISSMSRVCFAVHHLIFSLSIKRLKTPPCTQYKCTLTLHHLLAYCIAKQIRMYGGYFVIEPFAD